MALQFGLPGFRFHPTEEELLDFYLKNTVSDKMLSFDVIGVLNIYHHDPWKLPGLAKINGEREWYFFVPRDKKHGSLGRPNRTTENGFWKATGSDRKIMKSSDHKQLIGLRKTLVFYTGRAPRGSKTDWVMNEYRLPDNSPLPKDMVLCKIYRKATSMKVLEQRAAMEEAAKNVQGSPSSYSPPPSPINRVSFTSHHGELTWPKTEHPLKEEAQEMILSPMAEQSEESKNDQLKKLKMTPSLKLPWGSDDLMELQLPKCTADWTQDSFWTQFNSPWLQNLTASAYLLNL
ncbi:hypothetical protein CDL15_Pgr004435 [Punica granatum]|uniref:NAC domain-containing protein n=1 Tax=Punica granatum TaxID=22663 RepID=A0A218XGF3_PUNGR|nr:hypothetical protein CDL15_Pgr004435 [Punica granatum]